MCQNLALFTNQKQNNGSFFCTSICNNISSIHSPNRIKTLERCFSTTSTNKIKGHFQKQQDKTTGILVAIILVFVLCHIFRLTIQVSNNNGKYFTPP